MGAVIHRATLFEVNGQLRAFAAEHGLSSAQLLDGCRAALRELDEGRTPEVARLCGERAMWHRAMPVRGRRA